MEDSSPGGAYIWLLSTIGLFILEVLLNGFLCTCAIRSRSPPTKAGLPILLCNIWITNIIDGSLMFAGKVASHVLQVDTGYNGTTALIHNQERGIKDSWLITLNLGIPLKLATHSISNLLGIAICVDIGFLSEQPGFKSQVGRAVMNKRRAIDYIGLSWIIAVFLMCHPLVLSFVDTTAFLVVLYTWTIYMAFATFIIICLVLSVCCRRQFRSPEENQDMLEHQGQVKDHQHRTKAFSIFIQLILTVFMMLPWPLFETLHLHTTTRESLIKDLRNQFISNQSFGLFYQLLRQSPLLYYLIQPFCVLMFKEAREILPSNENRIRRSVKIGQTRAQFRPLAREVDNGRDQGELSEIESVL